MSPIPLGIVAASGAGAPSDFELISTQELTSTASNIYFTGIDTQYKHLQLRMSLRSNRASSLADVYLRFNADALSNYSYHQFYGNGSSFGSLGAAGMGQIFTGYATGSTFGGDVFAVTILDILDFSSSQKLTTTRSLTGMSGTNNQLRHLSGLWNDYSPVSSIQITPEEGSFIAGSRFSLYGIR